MLAFAGMTVAMSQQRRDQLAEGVGAVADAVLFGRVHLAERDVAADRLEHRIVAEAPVAARRPDEAAVDPAFEPFAMAVRPAQSERTDEMGVAARLGAELLQLILHPAHRETEIAAALHLARAGGGRHGRIARKRPARRMDAGAAVQGLDAEPAIVGQSGQA